MPIFGIKGKKILVTGGPTWVRLDAVRVISNVSSGVLAQTAVKQLAAKGAKVTFLEGPVMRRIEPVKNVKVVPFVFFNELEDALLAELKKGYDAVIHAAAVSDFRPKKVNRGKISSSDKTLKLDLIPTSKIIQRIKKIDPGTFLIGFKLEPKLTVNRAQKEVLALVKSADCDLVVANSLDAQHYNGFIFDAGGKCLAQAGSREVVVKFLVGILNEVL